MARYWEWDAPFTIHPEETALLIIDMQNEFVRRDMGEALEFKEMGEHETKGEFYEKRITT